MIKQSKKDKAFVEQWNAKQQKKLQDIPEIKESESFEEEDLSTRLSSKYEIKIRKSQASIDLNLPAPVE
jgi:hypothetical protein